MFKTRLVNKTITRCKCEATSANFDALVLDYDLDQNVYLTLVLRETLD